MCLNGEGGEKVSHNPHPYFFPPHHITPCGITRSDNIPDSGFSPLHSSADVQTAAALRDFLFS